MIGPVSASMKSPVKLKKSILSAMPPGQSVLVGLGWEIQENPAERAVSAQLLSVRKPDLHISSERLVVLSSRLSRVTRTGLADEPGGPAPSSTVSVIVPCCDWATPGNNRTAAQHETTRMHTDKIKLLSFIITSLPDHVLIVARFIL
jgi:hypothetical protein